MSEDKKDLVGNIVTENDDRSLERKARNRMVAEGYRYQLISDRGESDVLGKIQRLPNTELLLFQVHLQD